MKITKSIFSFAGILFLLILWGCKTGTEDDENLCSWQWVFNDDFERADGVVGSNYVVQVASGTGEAAVHWNQLRFKGTGFWAVRYVNEVTGAIQRVSLIFGGKINCNIMITAKSRDLGSNWMEQEFYGAAVTDSALVIQKCQGIQPATLATKEFTVVPGHLIRLELLVDHEILTASAEDLTAGVKKVLTFTDTGAPCTGTIVSINGCCLTDDEFILMDDFKVEVCK